MRRKVGLKWVAASTIALALGCSGAVDGDEGIDPSIASDEEEESIEPATIEQRIAGSSSSVTAPTNLHTTKVTQTTLDVAWGTPDSGQAASYILYKNGQTTKSIRKRTFQFTGLSCGTSYTLEAASRDSVWKVSPRTTLKATTTACAIGTTKPSTPSTPNTPTAPNTPNTPNTPSTQDPVTPNAPTGYAAAVLADSPLAYWRLNETSGTRATDAVGAHDGIYQSGVKLAAAGALDTAASFDGVDDVVSVADAAELRLNGSFSLEFMAKLGADANSWPGILAKGSAAADASGYIVYYSPAHKQPSFKRAGVDGMSSSDAGALSSSEFKHFVFTYDSSAATARWYVGGELDRTFSNIKFPLNLDSASFTLGRGDVEAGKVQYGNQVLDEVAVYGSALAADHVKAHFRASGLGTGQNAPVVTTPVVTTPVVTTPTTPVVTTPAPSSGFPIGACVYKTADFARLKSMGMKHARMDKPSAETIELARSYGIEVLPIADYGYADLSADGNAKSPPLAKNNAEWARRMVDTWRNMKNPPKVLEVWNEPWHPGFWAGKPNPAAYLELTKAFAAEAWKVWPNVTLLVSADSGMSDYPTFRKDLIAADKGGFLNDPRILPTTHNYVENRTPTQVTGNSCTYDLNRFQCAFQDFKNHGHPNPQVWVTEFGWESNSGGQGSGSTVTEPVMAQYTVDALEIFRKSGMVAAAYSFMVNSGDKWNYNWLRPDNSEKPVFTTVKNYLVTHP